MRDKNLAHNSLFALGDKTRLKIFLKIVELSASAFLGDEPILARNSAKYLSEVFKLAKSTVAHHIEILIAAELIFPVAKNRFIYLFPNYAKIKEFTAFLNEEVLIYSEAGEYIPVAEIYLKEPIAQLNEFCDYLTVYNCKNVQVTTDSSTNKKIYFKITGFNEPFYILTSPQKLQICALKKNWPSAQNAMSEVVAMITKLY